MEMTGQDKIDFERLLKEHGDVVKKAEELLSVSLGVALPEKTKNEILPITLRLLPQILSSVGRPRHSDQISQFLRLARGDLKLAKLAGRAGLDNGVAFHTQQAIEKVSKAYGLFLGAFDDVNRKLKHEVGHVTPNIYIKMMELPWFKSIAEVLFPDSPRDAPVQALKEIIEDEKKALELDDSIPKLLSG